MDRATKSAHLKSAAAIPTDAGADLLPLALVLMTPILAGQVSSLTLLKNKSLSASDDQISSTAQSRWQPMRRGRRRRR